MNELATKRWDFLKRIDGENLAGLTAALPTQYTADTVWNGSHPFNTLNGLQDLTENFWRPFTFSFPDWSRRNDIFFAQSNEHGDWTCALGHYVATFASDWIGIPANNALINLRFGEFTQFDGDKIVKTNIQFDIPGLLHQIGALPLKRGTGTNPWFPAPLPGDGVKLEATDAQQGQQTLQLINDMLDGLMSYDPEKKDLEQMRQHLFWAPNMLWYGPTGIGSTRRLEGFRLYHQVPFLHAYPDRKGGFHDVRMCAGHYAATCGWPSIHATHAGDYLGIAATGEKIEMRVMDFWRRQDNLLAENWVFIDLPHLLLQSGYDLIAEGIALAGS